MAMTDEQIDNHIPNSRIKERVAMIDNMEVLIYSRDHDPPHFHVKSKDGSIDAKFRIEDCSPLPSSGDLRNKVLKRIRIWYDDIKVQIILKKVWDKRNNIGPTA